MKKCELIEKCPFFHDKMKDIPVMKKAMRIGMIIITGFLFTFPALAQEYEELFYSEQYVEAALKRRAPFREVPQSVSIISRDFLEKSGFLDLYQALNFVPGVETCESFFGYTEVIVRGIYPVHFNNKTLFLLDQFSIYDPLTGNYYIEGFPVGAMEKLEVIRGPGTTIYGLNAFSGVLNFIPRRGENVNGFEIDLLGGVRSEGKPYWRTLITYGNKIKDYDLLISGDLYLDRGYALTLSDEKGITRTTNYRNLNGSLITIVKTKHFNTYFGYLNQEKDKFGILPMWETTGPNKLEGYYAVGVGNIELSEKAVLTIKFGTNSFRRITRLESFMGVPVDGNFSGNRIGTEVMINAFLPFNLSLLSGITFERLYTEPSVFINREDLSHLFSGYEKARMGDLYGYYLELGYSRDIISLYFGGRIDIDYEYEAGVSPTLKSRPTLRAGIAIKPLESLTLKAAYSEAFRYGEYFEYYANIPNVLIGSDLEKEHLYNSEFSIIGKIGKRLESGITIFYMDADNFIGVEPSERIHDYPYEYQYSNLGDLFIYGGEGEIKILPHDYVMILLNGTMRDGKLRTQSIPFLSRYMINTGIYFTLPYHISGSLIYSLIGPKEKDEDGVKSNADVGSTNVLNLNIAYTWKNLTLRVIFKNLLGEKIFYPEHIRGNVKTAGDSSRGFYIETTLKM